MHILLYLYFNFRNPLKNVKTDNHQNFTTFSGKSIMTLSVKIARKNPNFSEIVRNMIFQKLIIF